MTTAIKTGWRKAEARVGVEGGAIVGYVAEKVAEGWLLRLIIHPSLPQPADGRVYLVDVRSEQPRLFARADAVLDNAAAIGFDISQITSLAMLPKTKAKLRKNPVQSL
jgi:hypothetical protein